MDFCQKIWKCGINFCHNLRNFIMQFLKKGQSWAVLYCQRPKWGGHIMQHIYEVPNLSGNAFPAIVIWVAGGLRLWVHTKWGGVRSMSMLWVQGGRGGQKRPKKCVHTKWMPPYEKAIKILGLRAGYVIWKLVKTLFSWVISRQPQISIAIFIITCRLD